MGIGQWFGRRKRARWAVDKLHQSIVNQALRPEFYAAGGAKDNFSGRFEMTSLHAALLFRRLRATGSTGKALSQECFDALFEGFDEALRDIGTGDLSVGKKIRKMGEAFYGRARAYDLYEAAQGTGVFEGDVVRSAASDRCGSLWIPAHSSVVG